VGAFKIKNSTGVCTHRLALEMEFQSSFCALSLVSPLVDTSSCVPYQQSEHLEGCNDFGHKSKENPAVNQTGFPSVLIHADHPYRICEASDSFADVLGFKPKDLQGGSLRLFFGPATDLQKLKKIVGDEGQNDNDRLVLYRKDGDEIACSISSTSSSNLPSGERVSTISILNYRSAQCFPISLTAAGKQPSAPRHDGLLMKSATSSSISSIDHIPSISHDPALLVHLSAIRRCRRA
jgi:hypothetical protein